MNLPNLFRLMKYRLSLAVSFSAVTGYLLGRNSIDTGLILTAAGVFLLASGSAVLNQYTEREKDALMERTKGRPLPAKLTTPTAAAGLSAFLLFSGSCFLTACGFIPLILGITTVMLYNLVYTYLKKRTALAIIPGALVGALPPLIGYTAAGVKMFSPAILLFSIFMFLWQMPHFWLLLIKFGKEYRKAGFVTMSDYFDETGIRNIVFIWIVLSSLFLIIFTGLTGILSRPVSALLILTSPVFIIVFHRMLFPGNGPLRITGAFISLNLFGGMVMLLLIADSLAG